MFDFQMRYEEEGFIDDIDYDKIIADAEIRTGMRQDKKMLTSLIIKQNRQTKKNKKDTKYCSIKCSNLGTDWKAVRNKTSLTLIEFNS